MSRGQWLAFGPMLALSGCSSADETTPINIPFNHPDAPVDATVHAAPEVVGARVDGGSVCLPAFPGSPSYPPLAAVVCDPTVQYCVDHGFTGQGCYSFDAGPSPVPSGCSPVTCACFPNANGCTCTNDLDSGFIAVGCMTCYGAPPARLERLKPAVS